MTNRRYIHAVAYALALAYGSPTSADTVAAPVHGVADGGYAKDTRDRMFDAFDSHKCDDLIPGKWIEAKRLNKARVMRALDECYVRSLQNV